MELHVGDWRRRFRCDLASDANAHLISFDPYMFDRHGVTSSGGNMSSGDVVRASAAILDLEAGPVVVPLSTHSANNANAQHGGVARSEPVFNAVGLELAATVRADGNMMSMVFARGVPQVAASHLQSRFEAWLNKATAHREAVAASVRTSALGAPPLKLAAASAMQSTPTRYFKGNTETTQIGYVNRNNQRCTGHRGVSGTDHGQYAYRLECLNLNCGCIYGANGTDVFQRKCPRCGGGRPGIAF